MLVLACRAAEDQGKMKLKSTMKTDTSIRDNFICMAKGDLLRALIPDRKFYNATKKPWAGHNLERPPVTFELLNSGTGFPSARTIFSPRAATAGGKQSWAFA